MKCSRMKKSLTASVLLAIGLVAYAGEAEKYHGMVFSGRNSPTGYKWLGGQCVGRESGLSDANDCTFSLTEAEITTSTSKKIRVLFLKSDTGSRDIENPSNEWSTNMAISKIEDSIELSQKDGRIDTELCTSSKYPNTKIICSGEWHWREKPVGWGYMKPIKKAWRIDIETKKFVEIDTKSVKCELNEDRN